MNDSQQDAQAFLRSLLETFHEDANTVTDKPETRLAKTENESHNSEKTLESRLKYFFFFSLYALSIASELMYLLEVYSSSTISGLVPAISASLL